MFSTIHWQCKGGNKQSQEVKNENVASLLSALAKDRKLISLAVVNAAGDIITYRSPTLKGN